MAVAESEGEEKFAKRDELASPQIFTISLDNKFDDFWIFEKNRGQCPEDNFKDILKSRKFFPLVPRLKCRAIDITKNSQLEQNVEDPGTFTKSEKL